MVAILEVALGAIDEENVVAVDARQADEVVHLLIGNGERGIRAVGVGAEVIVVVTEIGIGRGQRVQGQAYLSRSGMDEEEIGDERLLHALSSYQFNLLFGIMHGEIGVDAQLLSSQSLASLARDGKPHAGQTIAICLLLLTMCHSAVQRCILYRHPGLELDWGSRARG
jgi:hypothetical protein